MISETEFAELGSSLSTGFFTDRVVLAVARTQRLGQLQKGDKSTLGQADRLLGKILRGEQWLERKRLDSKSAESALAFQRAVQALPSIRLPKDFVSYIEGLRRTAQAVLHTGTAPGDDLQTLRNFFFKFARAVSVESQKVIERSSEPNGVGIWSHSRRETSSSRQ